MNNRTNRANASPSEHDELTLTAPPQGERPSAISDEDEEVTAGTLSWEIDEETAGQRVDKFLAGAIEDESVSRSQIQDWIRDGHVTVGGMKVKPNAKLHAGSVLNVDVPDAAPIEAQPEDIPLNVVYEDGDVIVIDKPRGFVVHPAPGHASGTVVNALLHHCRDLSGINGNLRPGIVHRIDKDTSGLLMAAKNDLAHASLAQQLKDHSVTRRYTALVYGNVPHDRGTIDAPIGRDSGDRKLFTVTEKGAKRAVTHFTVLERFGDYTLVELQLETGRTHQIRVHMKYIGHTIVGDPFYGGRAGRTLGMEGQALHAGVLGFDHPRTGERILFEAPLPQDMEHALHMLRTR
ncbi:RluA family pseudouridine synthase [Cohnella hashimotonis]|uniref:Pseudouridine synthase n=1 Tax=Cohnella hashimotonis TaxID=2826895 RepID=A0ABT6TI66_9BACL|nr:RluA family pseudouridine synthase [Cohnella hashimotonis]MDI4646536.1 RluA family pseudouridine synthase [Cohnella hashimotonis]